MVPDMGIDKNPERGDDIMLEMGNTTNQGRWYEATERRRGDARTGW